MNRPAGPTAMVDVQREQETTRGWSYLVLLTRGDHATQHEVTLSWADHDYWSGGSVPPSRVVERVLAWLADEHPEFAWADRFDASTVRRRFPAIDDSLGRRM